MRHHQVIRDLTTYVDRLPIYLSLASLFFYLLFGLMFYTMYMDAPEDVDFHSLEGIMHKRWRDIMLHALLIHLIRQSLCPSAPRSMGSVVLLAAARRTCAGAAQGSVRGSQTRWPGFPSTAPLTVCFISNAAQVGST